MKERRKGLAVVADAMTLRAQKENWNLLSMSIWMSGVRDVLDSDAQSFLWFNW